MKRIGSHFGLNLVLSLSLLALFCGFWQGAPPTAQGFALAQSGNFVERQVTQSSDDAEEAVQGGSMSLTSSDLEFMTDPNGAIEQLVGIRFTDIDIPADARIMSANIEFTIDESGTEPTSVTIYGEATDHAVTFTLDTGNISQRLRTDTAILWGEIDPWTIVGDMVQTPDLSIILQEIVDRPGWQAQNALAFIFSGSGWRTAVAFEGNVASAPRLHIVWQSLPTATPTATATESPTATLASATSTPTITPTETTTPADTSTASPSATNTATALPSATTTPTPTIPATSSPTPSSTPDPRCSRTGAALRSLWFHMEGSLIEDLVRSARFPERPDQVQLLNQLDTAPNLDDDYADRIQGYLCPPQSAEYTFWIAGDDQSQLWLSSDNTPAQIQLIASVSDWTYHQEWDKFAEQQSKPILLTANQAYYFEILHKESINDDNLSVAWQAPNFGRQVISGRYLVPYADNLPPPESTIYLPLLSR